MAFLNPNVVINTATDAIKPNTAASNGGVDSSKDSDQFASALRKQMQQNASESSENTSQQATENNSSSDQTTSQAKSANQGSATQNTDASKKSASAQQDDQDNSANNNPVSGEVTSSKTAPKDGQVSKDEMSAAKKVLPVNTDSMSAADLTGVVPPWMQTMLAMRSNNTDIPVHQPSANTSAVSLSIPVQTAAKSVLSQATLPASENDALAALSQKPADVTQLPKQSQLATVVGSETHADPKSDLTSAKTGTDFKQILSDASGSNSEVSPSDANDKLVLTAAMNTTNTAAIQSLDFEKKPASHNTDISVNNSLNNAPSLAQVQMTTAPSNSVSNNPVATQMMAQISTPFGSDRWQNAINQHVMNMVSSGDDVASLTLSPPDLGPIQVVLKVDNQSVDASFISDNTQVRQALEDSMQNLRERMQSQGLELGQTFIGNGQQAQQHFGEQTGQNKNSSNAQIESVAVTTQPEVVSRTKTLMGLVDTFV